jgi:hypothetical protein
MDKQNIKQLKEELNDSFTDAYIKNVGILIHKMAEDFYQENELEGKVYFNENIFDDCLIDILVDIARLKHFHDITNVNIIKLMAYTASWCLKRKPFQLVEGCEEKYIYVNEKFALSLLLQGSGCFGNSVYYPEEEKELTKGIWHIFYHLKYRNTNPQTLELFLVGLENGQKLHMSC